MRPIRLFSIISWITLPTVMYGGYSLLWLLAQGDRLTPFQQTYFRAGHAHAGVLLLLSLLYYGQLARTTVGGGLKRAACAILVVGILAQSGGFFLHMAVGQPGSPSIGNLVTTIGAVLLATAVGLLVYAMITAWPAEPARDLAGDPDVS